MKRSVYIILVFLVVFASSCEDQPLITEQPSTFLNETNVYTSTEGAEAALTGVYSSLTAYHYATRSFPVALAMHSGVFHGDHNASKDLYTLNPLPNGQFVGQIWSDMYRMVNRANEVIANLQESSLTEAEKNPILGEVHFLRALTYFNLVRMWGDVPLTLEPTTTENLENPRAPRSEVFAAIIADLGKAKEMMPGPGAQRSDRPNKYAATSLLAKVYVTMASMPDFEPDSEMEYWQKAKDNALEVYNNGPYELLSTFDELWAPQKENSKEAIFEIQFNRTYSLRLTKEFMLSKFYPDANTWERVTVNKEVYDEHINRYPNDPRFHTTYVDSSYIKYRGGGKGPKEVDLYPTNKKDKPHRRAWPGLYKYYVPNISSATTANINWPFMRYADLLLLLAEAENELNGPGGAYQYVNEVLARARDTDGDGVGEASDPANWSGMSQQEFRERIMRERLYELLGEGQAWFDVRRRGYAYFRENVLEKHNQFDETNPDHDYIYPLDEKNMLFPIPGDEINGNPAIGPEDQNPGY